MGVMASQITSLKRVYSTVYSDVDQRKHQSSASPAFVQGIHRWPVNFPYKGPVTRKMLPFDDVITESKARQVTYIIWIFSDFLYPILSHWCLPCTNNSWNKAYRAAVSIICKSSLQSIVHIGAQSCLQLGEVIAPVAASLLFYTDFLMSPSKPTLTITCKTNPTFLESKYIINVKYIYL